MGTYRGGTYSTKTPASPPGYDPEAQTLFLGSDDREAIKAIDISDPSRPRKIFAIDLAPYGGAPDSMAVSSGLLAATVKDPDHPASTRRLLLLNVEGELLADPIALAGARRVVFTPAADRLVVGVIGHPGHREAGIAVFDLGPIDHRACRKGRERCGIQPRMRIVSFKTFDDRRAELIAAGVRILSSEATVSDGLRPGSITVASDHGLGQSSEEQRDRRGRSRRRRGASDLRAALQGA